ncbi:MAG: hypothetical protein ACKV2Q_24190 [Planctomycetaceae bacterium]
MKGPGLRIDVDVRRAWRCPTCGQSQRLPTDSTAPRCLCVRDGVPMKLDEGLRPGRLSLRPELRSLVDRIQAGEEFARLMPVVSAESEPGGFGGAKPKSRPPRPERSGERTGERSGERTSERGSPPPRGPRPPQTPASNAPQPTPPIQTSAAPTVAPPKTPTTTTPPADDDFGAGISSPAEP